MNNALLVDGLKKSYGSHIVLKGLTFEVVKGEIFALLGVNGAGKTTTLSCIEGLLGYEEGGIKVDGKMGIQLQSSSLPDNIRSMEAVRLFAKWNKAEIDYDTLDALGITSLADKQYVSLSTGQKRRLHLALALISNPDIVFLDEPTAGLDVEGRVSLHDQIRKLKAQGKTIVLSSHDMAEVENLCDRIAILVDGTIIFFGTVEELTENINGKYTLQIKTNQGDETYETCDIGDTVLQLLEGYKQKNITVLDIKTNHRTLEQEFMEIAGGNRQ